jgi:peptide/nickel transport system permease protein
MILNESELWLAPPERSRLARFFGGLLDFARRKPLGFLCGTLVVGFFIIGDAVPETVNSLANQVNSDWETPMPYFADQLEQTLPFVYPHDRQDLRARLQGSSREHLLGTDALGRDIFSRLIYGARIAVIVSFGSVTVAMTVGSIIGIVSGFYMGWIDKFLYRLVDVFQALPSLIVLITILGVFGAGLWQLVFVLGFVYGPGQSRMIRGQTISIMATPFIEAARVIGAGDVRIMRCYILPNVLHLVILNATVLLGLTVLAEATLSFLGYGPPTTFPSWGQLLNLEGRRFMRTQPGLAIYPGLAIGLLVFCFNLLGDALRDVLDPRLRGSR